MGNYVNANLTKEEHVVYEAHYHWGFWITPMIFILIFLLPVISNAEHLNDAPLLYIFPLISLAIFVYTYLRAATDEFAITNQRLIVKKGIISRETLELHLSKVETVMVSQGIFERLVGAGSISVRGTGSTLSNIPYISEPYEFRRVFQQVVGRSIPSAIHDGTTSQPATPTRPVGQFADPVSPAIQTQETIQSPHTSKSDVSFLSKSEQLFKLKELLDSGILTQEEFDVEKKKILNS